MGGRITVGRYLDKATDSVEVFQGTVPWVSKEITGMVPAVYDFVDLGYDGSNRLVSAVFKAGGAGGALVATLAITYIGASTRIDTVTRT
jgi:hypothetical protein